MTDNPTFWLVVIMLACVVGGAALAFFSQALIEMWQDHQLRKLQERMGDKTE